MRQLLVFDPVWLILERPRPNLNPPRFFAPGKLTIGDDRVDFSPSAATLVWPAAQPADVHLTLDHVVDVSRHRYSWGLVPRFIAVKYETVDGIAVAYFNDGSWHGWRPLLTGSNRRMAGAIRDRLGIR